MRSLWPQDWARAWTSGGASGHLVVDIGGGTTDIAILSMNGVAVSSSLKIAGNYFDEMIARYVRRQHGVVIGQVTAESVKIQIGQVYPRDEERSMNVKGRDYKTGMPKVVTLTSNEIYEVLRRPARQIADEVLAVMEQASPELVSDVSENGITITGGCGQLWGMDLLLMERTGIACILADDPDSCTAYGAGKSLAWINNMQEGPINIAGSGPCGDRSEKRILPPVHQSVPAAGFCLFRKVLLE